MTGRHKSFTAAPGAERRPPSGPQVRRSLVVAGARRAKKLPPSLHCHQALPPQLLTSISCGRTSSCLRPTRTPQPSEQHTHHSRDRVTGARMSHSLSGVPPWGSVAITKEYITFRVRIKSLDDSVYAMDNANGSLRLHMFLEVSARLDSIVEV
ncbi:hypothetical protein NDU88_005659 [Pleurodeles waltl]|uniref:Uncharacterized protein n=1 Tax=Pleurodeles waltl TaxID=8319 RepID=A0AAV7TBY4_PLEWA|nr:hypothetical protein NDU88_005659 [Pleurodeles waltl]